MAEREVRLTTNAWEDLQHWQAADQKICTRLMNLIEESRRDPFQGTGKPEPLKGPLKGWWSRRINQTHRLVYKATSSELVIAQARFHYDR